MVLHQQSILLLDLQGCQPEPRKKKYSNQNMQVHKISHNHIVKDLPGTPNTVGVCLWISCVYMPWLCICNHFAAQGEIKCTKFARQLWILGWSCLHNWTLVPIFYKVQCKYASFEYDGANSKFWRRYAIGSLFIWCPEIKIKHWCFGAIWFLRISYEE